MERKVWYTTAAIMWLQNLLQERFGHTLHLHPQPENNCIAIHLPGHDRSITLALDGATFIRADSDLPCAHWDAGAEGWHTVLSGELPAPGAAKLPTPLIASTENGVHIGYDILGLSYWMLTRQEEVGRTDLDMHGRFPAAASHAYKHGYLERPIVDEWFDLLAQVAAELWQTIPTVTRRPVVVQPSHDVDFPCRYAHCSSEHFVRNLAKDCLQNRPLDALRGLLIRSAAWRARQLPASDPYNTFDWIMSQSERHGLKSSFYMVCGGHHRLDPGYDPRHPAIRRLMRDIHARGHLLGLHPSYGCIDDPSMLANEFSELRHLANEEGLVQDNWGVRMHYLRCRYPGLWRQLDALGADYDASMGYADRVGFRAGTAYPYPAFDAELQKPYTLTVRPLVVMEGTLYADVYMRLTETERRNKLSQMAQACAQVGGDFSLLWHNSELTGDGMRSDFLHGLASCTTVIRS